MHIAFGLTVWQNYATFALSLNCNRIFDLP